MKNQKNYSRLIFAALVIFGAFYVNSVCADVIYQESGGMVVGEGELFSERTNDGSGNGWFAVPDENAGAGSFTNARGGAYIQSLPDNGSGGGPIVPPEVMYKMHIFSPGSYRLYIRWECNMSVGDGGNSDSIFCDIVELKDGVNPATYYSPTNQIADWYELAGADDGDFATNPWRSWGQAEINNAGGSGDNADWVITTQGVYTLRFTQREDGSAVDAFVFQKSDLPAPTGYGPAMSSLEQSRIVSEASDDTYLRRNDTNALHGAETSMLVKNDTSASAAGYDRFT